MNKKIASLFASVGFDIDTTDLTKLDGHLKSIRGNTANLSRNLRVANTQLNTTSTRMRNLAKSAEAVTKFNNLGGKYVTLAVKVKDAEAAIARFGRVLKLIEPRLDSTNFRLSQTTRSYMQLARAVKAANSAISQIPNKAPKPVSSSGISVGGISGSRTSARTNTGFGAGFLGGLASTVGRFTPTGLVGSTALTTAAVGVNEIRKAGQDQQRMENMLLFSTKSQEEYARSLKYVRDEAERLGLNSVELGKAFAQVNMSAREKMSETQRKKMFTEMSEYIMVTGAGQEDQKLIFKAVNQMFSLGRIMAEEMNQLTERGVPRQMIYDVAKEVYNVKSTEEVLKLQEKGKLDPAKILPKVFEQFAKQARDTGAYDKMMGSSIVAQNKFMEQLRQMSDQIMDAGLDKAIAVFFNTLTAGLPYLTTFVKGIGGVFKGLSELVKVVWSVVTAIGDFIGQHPKAVGTLSVYLLMFIMLIAKVKGVTLSFGILGKVLATLGRRIPLIAMLLALFYLFKEYDRFMKGEDSWMANFADWMIYLAETARLWKEELIGAFNAVKELRFGDAASGGVVQGSNNMMLNVNPFKRIFDKAKEVSTPEIPTPTKAMIPYASGLSSQPTSNYSGKLMGEVDVKISVDQNGRTVAQPVQRIPLFKQGGLRGN